jgi:NADPH:quinone reductase-like Zn-dependent oxidoreductase
MRAAVYTRYGPPEVVQIQDVAKPVPTDNEVLVRIHATTVCTADWRLRKADPSVIRIINGLTRPSKINILGMEFAGRIESVGKAVTRFRVGDEVFGGTGFKCACHAEYSCCPEDGTLAKKPDNITFEEASAVYFGGMTALYFLRRGRIQAGQKVLVYGASSSVGTAAVQLAKHFGAEVTAVCSTANLELAGSLGADEVVDYTREDFSKDGQIYDMVFDAVGKSGLFRSLKALNRGGFYVLVSSPGRGFIVDIVGSMLGRMWASLTARVKVVSGVTRGVGEDMSFLKGLMEDGKLRTVIDRCYPLDQIAEAHRYAEGGHKKGNVVILLGH